MRPGAGASPRWSARDLMLGAQVCLCSLLVVSCLVSLRGLERTLQTRLGFDRQGMYVASFDLNQAGYDRITGTAARERLVAGVADAPGVDAVSFTSSVPLTTDQSGSDVIPDRWTGPDPQSINAHSFTVPPGYFDTMRTALVHGREFRSTDTRVVIINEALARSLFGSTDVVGRGIRRNATQAPIEIVGVAEDGKYAMPGEAPGPAVFWRAGAAYFSSTQLLIRSTRPEDEIASIVRQTAAAVTPGLPITFQGSLESVTSLAFVPARAAAVVLGALGVLAVVLALSGIYGLAAYSVSARVREIGIRMAIGGRPMTVLGSILGRTAVVLVVGMTLGITLALAARPLLSMVVYQATSTDPAIVTSSILILGAVALIAAAMPAWRTLRVNPAVTLREG